MRTAPAVLAIALLVGTAACSDDDPGTVVQPTVAPSAATPAVPATTTAAPTTAVPTTSGPATTTAAPATVSAPPFPANTKADDGGEGSGNRLGLVAVRSARQAGFDRVTFEFGGTGTPGWLVDYTTNPTSDGSGEPVTLKGTTFLSVILRGVGNPGDVGLPQFGDSTTRIAGSGTRQVLEIAPGFVYEGQQQAYIGMSGTKRPFRVFSLADPPRVVVDVRDS